MPELPEVEAALDVLRTRARGRTIVRMRVLHPALRRRLNPKQLRALVGARIARVERRGKHQLLHLDDGRILHAHFRMNGDWTLVDTGAPLPKFARAVLDFDEACLAPRALDVTSYAANLVSGRPGDLARADAALASLLDGYGAPPQALHWYLAAALLRRAPSPFRLHKRNWLHRTEAIVAAAEAVLGR